MSDWGGGWEHFHIAQRLFTLQNILQKALFKILVKLHYEILWIKYSSLAWSGAEVNLIKSLSFTVEESLKFYSCRRLKGFGKSITK